MKLISVEHILFIVFHSVQVEIFLPWYLRYIESLLEILYAKPIATKSVMTPAAMVIIKFVLIT